MRYSKSAIQRIDVKKLFVLSISLIMISRYLQILSLYIGKNNKGGIQVISDSEDEEKAIEDDIVDLWIMEEGKEEGTKRDWGADGVLKVCNRMGKWNALERDAVREYRRKLMSL